MSGADVQAWLHRAAESLDIARDLLTREKYGFAVHHSYYAMLYAATAALASEGLAFSRHSAVIAAFGRDFAKTGRVPVHLHRYFIQAEELRIAADYANIDPTTQDEAAAVLTWATELVATIHNLLDTPSTS